MLHDTNCLQDVRTKNDLFKKTKQKHSMVKMVVLLQSHSDPNIFDGESGYACWLTLIRVGRTVIIPLITL